MRKTWKLALASAALVSGVAFTACSSDDEELLSGGSDTTAATGETGEVKTAISFAIPHAKTQRSTADYVQEGSIFKGMKNIYLLPFSVTEVGNEVSSTSSFLGRMDNLGDITEESVTKESGVKTYEQVSLPYGKVSFLLYGETQAEGKGILTPSYVNTKPTTGYTANDISFSLTAIEKPSTQSFEDALVALRTTLHQYWGRLASESAMKAIVSKLTGKFSVAEAQLTYMLNQLESSLDLESEKHNADSQIKSVRSAMTSFYTSYDLPVAIYEFDWSLNGATTISENTDIVEAGSVISYPPSLYYVTNSAPVDYSEDLFSGSAISIDATTQSVGLKNPVNYAVGRLDVNVKANRTTLSDSNNEYVDVEMSEGGSAFTLIGVVVGGQPGVVDYAFNNKSDQWNYMIYDNDVVDGNITTEYSVKTYVLGLPSQEYKDESSKAASVKVALELVNNGEAFYGVNEGLIPTGATFYLVGTLNPNVSDANGKIKAVFASDYYTTANMNITTLSKAYATLPDLTAANLEFALQVDLEWKEGIIINEDIE